VNTLSRELAEEFHAALGRAEYLHLLPYIQLRKTNEEKTDEGEVTRQPFALVATHEHFYLFGCGSTAEDTIRRAIDLMNSGDGPLDLGEDHETLPC